MRILWVSEMKKDLNGCRLYLDSTFAETTITKEMIADGYRFNYKSFDSFGTDSFGIAFTKDGGEEVELMWAFCWVEVEEETPLYFYRHGNIYVKPKRQNNK